MCNDFWTILSFVLCELRWFGGVGGLDKILGISQTDLRGDLGLGSVWRIGKLRLWDRAGEKKEGIPQGLKPHFFGGQ
jgi:hypothetical protein